MNSEPLHTLCQAIRDLMLARGLTLSCAESCTGGGVAAAPEHLLLEPLRETVARESFSSHGGIATRVLRAELGNDAGIIGAAMLGRAI